MKRIKTDLFQSEVAAKSGFRVRKIKNWEHDRAIPTDEQRRKRAAKLPALENHLNISDEELDNSKAKVMLWDDATNCPYWVYRKK